MMKEGALQEDGEAVGKWKRARLTSTQLSTYFYGFREMPFNITPDPRFLYLSRTHQEALQHLKFGVREKKGFIVLVGEVGCVFPRAGSGCARGRV